MRTKAFAPPARRVARPPAAERAAAPDASAAPRAPAEAGTADARDVLDERTRRARGGSARTPNTHANTDEWACARCAVLNAGTVGSCASASARCAAASASRAAAHCRAALRSRRPSRRRRQPRPTHLLARRHSLCRARTKRLLPPLRPRSSARTVERTVRTARGRATRAPSSTSANARAAAFARHRAPSGTEHRAPLPRDPSRPAPPSAAARARARRRGSRWASRAFSRRTRRRTARACAARSRERVQWVRTPARAQCAMCAWLTRAAAPQR